MSDLRGECLFHTQLKQRSRLLSFDLFGVKGARFGVNACRQHMNIYETVELDSFDGEFSGRTQTSILL